ncbi:MAG: DUF2793 domain-containing protein [Methyloligellaceae bacterium]
MPTIATPSMNFPTIQAAQSQKHVTVNQSLRILDAILHLSVESRNTSSPPQSPENGERYLVPAGSTSEWSEETNRIAVWQDNSWVFFLPKNGWRLWVEDEAVMLVLSSGEWQPVPFSATEIQNLMQLGINATSDSSNRLYVKSPTVTFEAENQDIRCVLNKDSSSDTASIIMQSDASGHAEIGLTGDNNLHIKTSPDGTNWENALTVASSTGETAFHQPPALPQISKNSLPSPSPAGKLIYVSDATGGSTPAFSDGTDWKRISDNSIVN